MAMPCSVVAGFLDAFLDVEEGFKLTSVDCPTTEQEAVDAMRKVGGRLVGGWWWW